MEELRVFLSLCLSEVTLLESSLPECIGCIEGKNVIVLREYILVVFLILRCMRCIYRLELSGITYDEYLDSSEWFSVSSARLHDVVYLIQDIRSHH